MNFKHASMYLKFRTCSIYTLKWIQKNKIKPLVVLIEFPSQANNKETVCWLHRSCSPPCTLYLPNADPAGKPHLPLAIFRARSTPTSRLPAVVGTGILKEDLPWNGRHPPQPLRPWSTGYEPQAWPPESHRSDCAASQPSVAAPGIRPPPGPQVGLWGDKECQVEELLFVGNSVAAVNTWNENSKLSFCIFCTRLRTPLLLQNNQKLIALPCWSSPCSVLHIDDKTCSSKRKRSCPLVLAEQRRHQQQLQKRAIISKVAELVKA